MKGDISLLNISKANLSNIDISQVTKWPKNLNGIFWNKVKGLNSSNTPFKGDLSLYNVSDSFLKKVDVSQVTKWPKNVNDIHLDGVCLWYFWKTN